MDAKKTDPLHALTHIATSAEVGAYGFITMSSRATDVWVKGYGFMRRLPFWVGTFPSQKRKAELAPLREVGTVRRWSSTLGPRHASGGTGLCSGIIPAALETSTPTLAHDHLISQALRGRQHAPRRLAVELLLQWP